MTITDTSKDDEKRLYRLKLTVDVTIDKNFFTHGDTAISAISDMVYMALEQNKQLRNYITMIEIDGIRRINKPDDFDVDDEGKGIWKKRELEE